MFTAKTGRIALEGYGISMQKDDGDRDGGGRRYLDLSVEWDRQEGWGLQEEICEDWSKPVLPSSCGPEPGAHQPSVSATTPDAGLKMRQTMRANSPTSFLLLHCIATGLAEETDKHVLVQWLERFQAEEKRLNSNHEKQKPE